MASQPVARTNVKPLVSFVVPCYQLGHLLPECIHSILAQTYHDFEILIMDNCSPDDTPIVARSFDDPRVKHIRNESNIGHIRNYNKGITLSQGKYVWWISPDDLLYSPHALVRFVDLMERNPGVGYVFCRCMELQGTIQSGIAAWTDCGEEDGVWGGRDFLTRLVQFNCIVQSSGMARRECYEKVGLFPTDLIHAGDWYLWCRMALHYDVGYVAEPMVCWRNHGDTMTAALNRDDITVCIGEQLSVLWRISQQAGLVGGPALRAMCRAGIVQRGLAALQASSGTDQRQSITETELETILRSKVADAKEVSFILAQLYSDLAGQEFSLGQYIQARRLYRRALSIRPWCTSTRIKYLFLNLGGPGLLLRRLSRQLRHKRYAHKWLCPVARCGRVKVQRKQKS